MILGTWLFVLAVLVAIAFATGGEDEAAPAERPPTPVAEVAERVEALRGLRFRTAPEPETVTPEQTRREGLESFDEGYPAEVRAADEDILALLGVVPADIDLREITEEIYTSQVAGYYDPERKRLRVVEGTSGGRVLSEIVLAHELVHALEDQRFGLDLDEITGIDDRVLAYGALVEGTASAVMFEYGGRHFSGEELVFGLLGSAFAPPAGIPTFLAEQLAFPYARGQTFVERLYEAAGDSWLLVDLAHRERPPASTEQILHPDDYLRGEEPQRVRVPTPPGWTRRASGTLGEFQTKQVLHEAGGTGARDAAEGWGGDRYVLLERGGESALVVRWRWDTARDAAEFLEALRAYSRAGVANGFTTVAEGGGSVTLVIAGSRETAGRLASDIEGR